MELLLFLTGMVSAFQTPMSRNFIYKVCLFLGLSSVGYFAFGGSGQNEQVVTTHQRADASERLAPDSGSISVLSRFPTTGLVQKVKDFITEVAPSADGIIPPPTLGDGAVPAIADDPVVPALDAESFVEAPPFSNPFQGRGTQHSATPPSAPVESNPAIPLLPNALPVTSKSSSVSNGSVTSGSGSGNAFAGLKNEDYAALVSVFKAGFEDTMSDASGQFCNSIDQSCSGQVKPVHSLRWNMDEGLNRAVGFAIKSIGPTLQFDVDFKIQKSVTNEETVSLKLNPINIIVLNELKDGKNFRVYEFHFADTTIRGETINRVRARMVFESNSTGLVATTESRFQFSRSKVSVALGRWEPLAVVVNAGPSVPAGPAGAIAGNWNQLVPQTWVDEDLGRKPSSEDSSYLIADELFYSIKVEKS